VRCREERYGQVLSELVRAFYQDETVSYMTSRVNEAILQMNLSSFLLLFNRTWEELARLSHPSVFIANIDCGAEKELCRSHQITTYPTFRYYKDGVENDYNDARSLEALREFVDTTLSVQCNPIEDGSTCSERALKYGGKWIGKSSVGGGETMLQGEIDRLEKMMLNSDSTTTELMRWIRERRDILKIIKQHKSSEGVHSKKGDKEDL
jgi:hypothetical protein